MDALLDELPPCVGCGSCCRLVVELAATDDVPPAMVADRAGIRFMDQQGDGACVALDRRTKSCTIYERRPQTCRDFRRGEALCRKTVAGHFGHFSAAPVPNP
jgi:uncharacterized protein